MNHRLDAWEVGAAVVTLSLMAAVIWLPGVAIAAVLVGAFAGLGVGAWFWGTDSPDPADRDPFGPR